MVTILDDKRAIEALKAHIVTLDAAKTQEVAKAISDIEEDNLRQKLQQQEKTIE